MNEFIIKLSYQYYVDMFLKKLILHKNPTKFWFSVSNKKYKKYLSDHILKIIENKPQHYTQCEYKFTQLLNKYPWNENPINNGNAQPKKVEEKDRHEQDMKTQLNMIFRVYDLPNVLQKFKDNISDLIIKNQIKSQSDLDRITNWLLKNIKTNKNISLEDINNIKKQQSKERQQFEEELIRLSNNSAKLEISEASKRLREKFISIDSKEIYDRLKNIQNQKNANRSCKNDLPSNKKQNKQSKENEKNVKQFWDKLQNIKPRLITQQCNDPQIYKTHLQITQGKLRFRFPPQPNGYLHIGHIKSIRINFQTAKRYGGVCYLRYDDTNPQTQSHEYIDNILKSVRWLGYEPDKITYASDYFDEMINLAIQLIKQGHAYVCDSPQIQIQKERKQKVSNKYRQRSISQSLTMFPSLQEGQTLRLKLDPLSKNPTLRDPVIYRIKQHSHPRTGDKYKIYPLYDFAHCICDSLEHIDYSLCSLEFQVRRELYYKILDLLRLYKPSVWEYSRLNVEGSVISKRKIKALIDSKAISSWTDPRLLTIGGLINRGYTPAMLLSFIDKVNASRAGNENVVQFSLLERQMRKQLYKSAEKSMMVLRPRAIEIEDMADQDREIIDVDLFTDDGRKQKRKITLSRVNYIEEQDEKGRLHIGQTIVLKYAGPFQITQIAQRIKMEKSKQSIKDLKSGKKQFKTVHWISQKDCATMDVFLFEKLLGPQQKLNEQSKVVCKGALIPTVILEHKHDTQKYWQMERLGYFKFDRNGNFIRCTTLQ